MLYINLNVYVTMQQLKKVCKYPTNNEGSTLKIVGQKSCI